MNLADKTIINILAKSGEAVLLLISSIVMVRCLTREEYGTFLQIMLIMNTAVMLSFFGMPQSVLYFLHRTSEKVSFVRRNIIISIMLGSCAALLVYSISNYIAHWLHNPLLYEYRYVPVALVFLRGSIIMRESFLVAQGNLILNSITSIISNTLFYIPVMIGASFSVGLSIIFNILLISSVVDFFCFLILMVWFVKHVAKIKNFVTYDLQPVGFIDQLRYAFPIGISSYIGVLGRQIDQYIIAIFFSPQSFAVYSRGAMRVPVLSNIQFIVNDIMMSHYIKDYHNGNINGLLTRFHLCIEKVAKINFPVFIFLFLASPSLITMLYTNQYLGAVPIFRSYLFLLLINVTTFGIIPRVTGDTKCIFYASLINIVANIILSCLLVPLLGAVGAAIATILCAFFSAFYYLFVSCRLLEISMNRIFPWKFLAYYLGVSFFVGIPAAGVGYICSILNIPVVLSISLEAAVYCIGLIIGVMRLDLLTTDDLNVLSRWMRIDAYHLFRKIALL